MHEQNTELFLILFFRLVTFLDQSSIFVEKFKLHAEQYNFRINFKNFKTGTLDKYVEKAINCVLNKIKEKCKNFDKLGLTITSENIDNRAVHISIRDFDQMTSEAIMLQLSSVLQSNESFIIDGLLYITAIHCEMPCAMGRNNSHLRNLKSIKEIMEKFTLRSIIKVENDDTMCFMYAVVLAIDRVECRKNGKLMPIKVMNSHMTKSFQIIDYLNIQSLYNTGADVNIMQIISNFLASPSIFFQEPYRLIILDTPKSNHFLIEPHPNFKLKSIFICYVDNHTDVITSITAFLNEKYYCELCLRPYSSREKHINCINVCPSCKKTPPCKVELATTCNKCNKIFVSNECKNNHLKRVDILKGSICFWFRKCLLCHKNYKYDLANRHQCYS